MSDHYYTNQPSSKSEPQYFETTLIGTTFQFKTDSGVFSKDRIDYGSEVLINAVSEEDLTEGDLLDVGCGYGPIGLALAKQFKEKEVHMIDINERAVELAKENAETNDIRNVSIQPSSLFEKVEKRDFSAVLSNPPIRAGKKTVHSILEEAYEYLKSEGKLFIVIQKKQGAPSAKKKMQEVFGNVTRIVLDKGYWVLMSEKSRV